MSLLKEYIPSKAYLPTSSRMSLPEWIKRAGIVLDGKPYSTAKHEYLTQILADEHPYQVFEKGAQVAISTTTLIKSLWVAEHLGKTTVYYFQDDGAVSDFSNDRCQPMIDESPYLSSRCGKTTNVGLKQLGPGSLYFRGLFTKGKAKSISVDLVVLDELDEAREDNVNYAIDRLMHSSLQWVVALSQPSVPGFGIDREFAETDQHFWHIICDSCGEYNCLELNFPDNFLPIPTSKARTYPEGATHYRGCKKCESQLNMAHGEWVPRHPGRLKRGYHLSQLYTQIKPPTVPNMGTKFIKEYEEYRRSQSRLARFTISVLGFPFAGGLARITEDLLNAIEDDYTFSFRESGAWMGVDQGDTLSVAIGIMSGSQLKFVHFEETEDWKRLDFLMQQFGVHHCVIDAQPNKHNAKSFAARYPKRVSIQYFGSKELTQGKELLEGKVEVDKIVVDRTEAIDATIDRMEMGQIYLPARNRCEGRALSVIEDVRRHLKQLVARNETTPGGFMKKVYLSGNSIENHYGMAINNAALAAFELGFSSPGPMVTPIFGGKMGRA